MVYPNPSRDEVNAKLYLLEADQITLSVLGMQGNELRSINMGKLVKGTHSFKIPTRDYAPGIYFIRARTSRKVESVKIAIQR